MKGGTKQYVGKCSYTHGQPFSIPIDWFKTDPPGQAVVDLQCFEPTPYIAPPSPDPDPPDRPDLHPNIFAFLDAIAWCEGTDGPDGYRTMFTGKLFNNGFVDHPRQLQKGGGYSSDAAGRYQFMSYTWDDIIKAINLPNFEPYNQDLAGEYLLKRRDAYDDIVSGDTRTAVEKCSFEWASLPPGQYGQPVKTMNEFLGKYIEALKKYGGVPDEDIPISSTGTFKMLDRLDEYGGQLFELAVAGHHFECVSGQPGHKPVHPSSDYSGSMNPICQGKYKVGPSRYDKSYEGNRSDGIGPHWIEIHPNMLPNGRGGFLIHMDFNWHIAAGTAGCISPTRERHFFDIKKLVDEGRFTS
jgi:muramidase (phage lysozyme)